VKLRGSQALAPALTLKLTRALALALAPRTADGLRRPPSFAGT